MSDRKIEEKARAIFGGNSAAWDSMLEKNRERFRKQARATIGDKEMTHSGGKPHTNVGDRGQRFEVRSTGYPKEHEVAVGWAESVEAAGEMALAFRQAPGCLSTTILDRKTKRPVITQYSGVLR